MDTMTTELLKLVARVDEMMKPLRPAIASAEHALREGRGAARSLEMYEAAMATLREAESRVEDARDLWEMLQSDIKAAGLLS